MADSPDTPERIAAELERLAQELRAVAHVAEPSDRWSRESSVGTEAEGVVGEAIRRLRGEADRAVAEAVRVLDGCVDTARTGILDAEREARERILATTESACARIEAVDRAQERVAAALSRLEPPGPGGTTAGDR